jgi:hypothetical protein
MSTAEEQRMAVHASLGTVTQKNDRPWQRQRNAAEATVDWQFQTKDARIKLKRLYPKIYS